jgi:hypothetical protein
MSSHEPTKMYFFLDILIEIIITCISMVHFAKNKWKISNSKCRAFWRVSNFLVLLGIIVSILFPSQLEENSPLSFKLSISF